ncbi:MAG: cyclic peptide export ABC transporter [Desulfobacteraceae bacterium]|nr:cyclic peptide export ABC transporter [Desulfobacteraceae bacterium]
MKIKIIEFFDREYNGPKGRIILTSCLGSLCFPALLAIANRGAEITGYISTWTEAAILLIYLLISAVAVTCKISTLNQATIIAEEAVRSVRVRLADKLRRTELRFLETEKKGEIYARIVEDTEIISQTSANITNTLEAFLTSIVVFLYMMTISVSGFVVALLCIVCIYGVFFSNYFKVKEKIKKARLEEADFFDLLNDTLSGFKEIKINSRKNSALFADIEDLSHEIEANTLEPELEFDKGIIVLGSMLLNISLGVLIFIVPLFSHSHGKVVIKLVTSMLFVIGLMGMVLRGTSVNVMANVGVENLERLEDAIDEFGVHEETEDLKDSYSDFREIVLDSVVFQYMDKEEVLFKAGPIDLKIRQGEILFIVGGNGSGKSTLLKLLTGLYYPMAGGRIITDDRTVTRDNYQSYRELFSIIFTDFHLFRKLYGLESVDGQKVKSLLKKLDIHTKTDYSEGRFINTNLSTGQRKRLAYIAALLENKPVYVFDEWAADQDPVFRKHFYENFLEDLRTMNKTVIAVTHDDRYFDSADRVIKLEEGKIAEYRVTDGQIKNT